MDKQNYEISGGTNQVVPNATHVSQHIYFGPQEGEKFARRILEKDSHPIQLVITGSGVDATLGIPTSAGLISHITEFLETDEGKTIDTLLRKAIGNVRFHFDKFVSRAIDQLAHDLERELRQIYDNIHSELNHNPNLSEEQRKLGRLIMLIFQKIHDIKDNASIDQETELLITEVLGEDIKDETIIDLSRLNYTETFKSLMVQILQRSIRQTEDPILRHVYRHIFDIEQLLVDNFYGFYSGSPSRIRNYLYISWTLWAYLITQERHMAEQYAQADTQGTAYHPSLYAQLQGMDIEMLSFNYTTFARSICPEALYFYGSVMQYIDVENKNEIPIPDLANLSPADFISTSLQGNIHIEGEHPNILIPSMLPHLKVLPFLSGSYIDTWYRAGELVRHASTILLLGYDFPHDNDFLHDKLRTTTCTHIILIDKDLSRASQRICRAMQIYEHSFTPLNICGHKCRKYNNRITVVEGDLETLNLQELMTELVRE